MLWATECAGWTAVAGEGGGGRTHGALGPHVRVLVEGMPECIVGVVLKGDAARR